MLKLGRYLLANNSHAGLLAIVCILLPWPFNTLAPIVVALITLQKGVLNGLIILGWAILPPIAATWKWPAMAVSYDASFVVCIFCWIFAALLRWQRHWGRSLEALMFLGVIFALVQSLLLPAHYLITLTDNMETILLNGVAQTLQAADLQIFKTTLEDVAPQLFNILYAFFAGISVIYLMLARLWQLKMMTSPQKSVEFYNIQISRPFAILFSVSMLAFIVFHLGFWSFELWLVGSVAFTFGGISLLFYIKAINYNKPYLQVVIAVLGVIAFVLYPKSVLTSLALLGLVDSLIDFRKLHFLRIKRVNP